MQRIILFLLLLLPLSAFAQQATVVTSCAAGRSPNANVGNQIPLMVDPAGNLCSGATVIPSGTQDINQKQVNGVTTSTGAGATGTGSQRVTVSQDATTVAGSTPGGFTQPVSGTVSATPLAVTPTDRGGTITVGGTAQNAAASNASRKSMLCMNPVSATEDLYIAVTGSATVGGAGNFADLAPGGSATVSFNGTVIQTAVSVNAATTAHRFLCTEMQ